MIRSMIDIDGNWDLIETNLQDYLENNLRNKFTTEGRKSDELVAKRLMTGELETGYEKRQELEIVSEPEETESIDVRDIQKNVFNNRVIEEILKEYLV